MPSAYNLAADVMEAGRARPGHPALVVLGERDETWTHADLLAAVERRAGGLAALGLPAGARVMLRVGDTPDFPITHLACAAAGLVPVPTSAALTAPEVAKMAARIAPALAVGDALPLPPDIPAAAPGDLDGAPLPFDDWPRGDPDRLGYIVFTSGSGGTPKAVAHAHRAVRARRSMWDGWYGLTPDDRLLHAGAFNWTFTLGTGLLDPWAIGATALIPAPGTSIEALPALLARADATLFAAAPGVVRRMLRAPLPPLPRLRHALVAGEALSPAIRADWEAATGTPVHEALGMSECSTFVSGSPARPAPGGTAGFVQPGRRTRIAGGTLQVGRGDPGLMLGYWEDGAVTPVPEWFDTGDRVEEAGGAIRHLGRADDLLNPGGIRVSPQEVEAALAGLAEDLAVGTVTTGSGAVILAAFHVGGIDLAAAEARAAERLAPYKRPKVWLRRDALPRNANGKLIRRRLA
ncbi:acyl--CoA ligase [Jannaschia sp. Os4]|nr:acyl--CoA ligase [Jannaschia sp. Os4]